jgi:formylglycine-generating enzyme required for sulfatase activity
MVLAVFLTAALAANPAPEDIKLLKTFRGEFLQISPGSKEFSATFTMGRANGGNGNERPTRQVTLAYEFQIAKYEVPQNLWKAVMGSNPSKWTGPRNSVEMLSFDEAERFCKLATTQMRSAGLIQKNQTIRLPTEAEWEFVARAGTATVYSHGDDEKQLDDYGWHTGNAGGYDPPVGVKKPNPWGLYDIHGYLWEWCTDHGHDSYTAAPTDGSSWSAKGDQTKRILRGGSWKDKPAKLTSSYRRIADKDLRDDAVGLRCVLATEK